ncbi:MAG TPA: deoxyribose-phosphate aldolase [Solirubrobacteraceae bacterium]|jgi:deoxyribose-phosphate aldolase|nr:deoxyribose-phosphate aldolase [Solirubrobacteraceae bacterium]
MSVPLPQTRAALAALIDHTLLRPEAAVEQVRELCHQAREYSVCAACVTPTMVRVAAKELEGSDVRVAAVIGFPSGAHLTEVKALEAERAVADGAAELDMVINLALARVGDWRGVTADIAGVRAAAPSPTLKVILEARALERDQLIQACLASERAGAQFVKTSTGFHPTGGATVEDVRVMSETVGDRLGVKASGSIRTAGAALELIQAGATRLGLSGTPAVLDEMPA